MLKILLNNRFIGAFILLNAIVTILLTFNTPIDGLLRILDHAITILFLVEIFYKIYVYKKDFFKSRMNVFDLVIILVASLPLFFLFSEHDPADYNYILLLRVFRIFKFIRFGKFIPNFSRLIRDLGRAVKASLSLIVGALVMMIIISTILTYMFKDAYPTLFGNPFESAYTVFRMLTIEGWYEIPDFMAEDIPYTYSVLIRLFFSLFVFLGGMLGMSFFTSLIVDEMVSDNNDELVEKVESLEKKIDELHRMNKELIDKIK
ncbi:ion transporter [Prevotella sp. 10(H)]|uniref:ion transporter n=1 Tax=Prevotella sp. 10(H) TaxID=1158294 RepID=UPI0004A70674|nr:ion transporter [Prevotella sp. 10(H)]